MLLKTVLELKQALCYRLLSSEQSEKSVLVLVLWTHMGESLVPLSMIVSLWQCIVKDFI